MLPPSLSKGSGGGERNDFCEALSGFYRCLAFAADLLYNRGMYSNNDEEFSAEEIGSDELLSADELSLPASANILVRLHALRSWLSRRYVETQQEVGMAALDVQEVSRDAADSQRPRRRHEQSNVLLQRAQHHLLQAQQRLSAYDEAQILLENCVAHTTAGERLLVEFYLSLEELVAASASSTASSWSEVMATVLQHVEQLAMPGED